MKGAFLPRLSVLLPAARRCGLMATGLTGLKTFFFSPSSAPPSFPLLRSQNGNKIFALLVSLSLLQRMGLGGVRVRGTEREEGVTASFARFKVGSSSSFEASSSFANPGAPAPLRGLFMYPLPSSTTPRVFELVAKVSREKPGLAPSFENHSRRKSHFNQVLFRGSLCAPGATARFCEATFWFVHASPPPLLLRLRSGSSRRG